MYTGFVKNVTISLDDQVLAKARKRAGELGQSFNEYVRGLLDDDSEEDRRAAAQAAFDYADRLGKRSSGPFLTREEANERR